MDALWGEWKWTERRKEIRRDVYWEERTGDGLEMRSSWDLCWEEGTVWMKKLATCWAALWGEKMEKRTAES